MNYNCKTPQKLTDDEKSLVDHVKNYIDKKPTDRKCLMILISKLSQIAFCHQTPFSIKQQLKEIDEFCNHLKHYAKKIKK
jgi:hypothetical protein